MIESVTGAKIEMSSSKDRSLTFLITGKPDTVMKAKREVLQGFQTQGSATISIPKEHHRHLLGKGGSKLQDLEKMTSTKITIPKPGDTDDGIKIMGNKEGIEKALHEIKLISDEQSKQAFEKIMVPKIYHPFVEGANRININNMMEKYPGVRINIPPLSVVKDDISIAGEKEGVLAVKATILQISKDMEKKCSSISVEVKKSQHRYVIGPKGNAINEILAETGVFVEMPSPDSNSEPITLRGPQQKLGLALNKVYEKANSVVNESVHCPTWLHKYIIGRKGAGIQKISQDLQKVHIGFNEDDSIKIKSETDVTINIPDSDSGVTIIRIDGNKAGVE